MSFNKQENKLKTIIAGGRDYVMTAQDFAFLDTLPISEVVCGEARGADISGKYWAMSRGIPVISFYPDWKQHGKSAGILRNVEMAEYAEAVVLFPGGRGTTHMGETADKNGLTIYKINNSKNTFDDRSIVV